MKRVFYTITHDDYDDEWYAELFTADGKDFDPDIIIAEHPRECQDKAQAVIREKGFMPCYCKGPE